MPAARRRSLSMLVKHLTHWLSGSRRSGRTGHRPRHRPGAPPPRRRGRGAPGAALLRPARLRPGRLGRRPATRSPDDRGARGIGRSHRDARVRRASRPSSTTTSTCSPTTSRCGPGRARSGVPDAHPRRLPRGDGRTRTPGERGPGSRSRRAGVGRTAGTERVTVHRFCQSTNVLGAGDLVERTIEQASGAATTPLTECETCCGFGGSTSILRPEMAAGVLARKLACVAESGADVLVADNPGCVLHLARRRHGRPRPRGPPPRRAPRPPPRPPRARRCTSRGGDATVEPMDGTSTDVDPWSTRGCRSPGRGRSTRGWRPVPCSPWCGCSPDGPRSASCRSWWSEGAAVGGVAALFVPAGERSARFFDVAYPRAAGGGLEPVLRGDRRGREPATTRVATRPTRPSCTSS